MDFRGIGIGSSSIELTGPLPTGSGRAETQSRSSGRESASATARAFEAVGARPGGAAAGIRPRAGRIVEDSSESLAHGEMLDARLPEGRSLGLVAELEVELDDRGLCVQLHLSDAERFRPCLDGLH